MRDLHYFPAAAPFPVLPRNPKSSSKVRQTPAGDPTGAGGGLVSCASSGGGYGPSGPITTSTCSLNAVTVIRPCGTWRSDPNHAWSRVASPQPPPKTPKPKTEGVGRKEGRGKRGEKHTSPHPISNRQRCNAEHGTRRGCGCTGGEVCAARWKPISTLVDVPNSRRRLGRRGRTLGQGW